MDKFKSYVPEVGNSDPGTTYRNGPMDTRGIAAGEVPSHPDYPDTPQVEVNVQSLVEGHENVRAGPSHSGLPIK